MIYLLLLALCLFSDVDASQGLFGEQILQPTPEKGLLESASKAAAGQRNIVRTMSDAHIGSYWTQNSQNIARFFSFLSSMADPNTNVSRLILLGDFVELWLVPYNQQPESWYTLMTNSTTTFYGMNYTQFRDALISIANNNVTVVMMWGNHDLESPSDNDFNTVFNGNPNIIKIQNHSYLYQSVMYEHGHYYDLFNIPFPPNSNLAKLLYPFGYYVSRAAAQTNFSSSSLVEIQENCWVTQFSNLVVDALQDRTVMETVLWALVASPDKSLILQHDTVLVGGDPTNMTNNATFAQIIPQYNNMTNEWIALYGEEYVSKMLLAATTHDVDYFVQMQPADVLVNIMGHTHVYDLKRLKRSDNSTIIYANSGAWVDAKDDSYIDVVYDGTIPVKVVLGSYKNATMRYLSACYVNSTAPCSASSGSGAWHLSFGPWSMLSLVLGLLWLA